MRYFEMSTTDSVRFDIHCFTLTILYYMHASYTETRAHFADYWNRVIESREPLIITRKGAEDIALIPASELASLMETAHLLRSPKNAKRLLKALKKSLDSEGTDVQLDELKKEASDGQTS